MCVIVLSLPVKCKATHTHGHSVKELRDAAVTRTRYRYCDCWRVPYFEIVNGVESEPVE